MKYSGGPPCEVPDDASKGRETVIKKSFFKFSSNDADDKSNDVESRCSQAISALKCEKSKV